MKSFSKLIVTLACVGLVGSGAMFNPGNAYASDKHEYRQGHSQDRGKHRGYKKPRVIHHGPTIIIPDKRVRRYHKTYVYRAYGHWYNGYGHYRADDDALAWLAFTAITLKVLDNLNEDQQRAHEAAQIRATSVPVGETVIWNQGEASGSVTATRDGTTSSGRYCREFQHEISVGGQREQAYGVACQQPDGSWEIVSTGSSD